MSLNNIYKSISDDESIFHANNSNEPQPLKRALSFPFEASLTEIANIENNMNIQTSNSIPSLENTNNSLSQQSLSQNETSELLTKRKFQANVNNHEQPPKKKRRIVTRARAARYTHLSDLLKCGILEVGETISLKGQKGVVCREGWIEYGDTRYPGAWTWCNAIKQNVDVSLAIPLHDSLNTQSEEQLAWNDTIIESKNAALNDYKELYEKEDAFRKRLQEHKLKLLRKKRFLQRQREKERLGLPPSQNNEDFSVGLDSLLPPSPYKSNLSGFIDDSESSDMDDEMDEDYSVKSNLPKTNKKKKQQSPSNIQKKRRRKKNNTNNNEQTDFSKWTDSNNNRNKNNSSTVITNPNTSIVEIEQPTNIPESDDFFSIPPDTSEQHINNENSSSLNSLVQNLIHLADGTETQINEEDIEVNDIEINEISTPLKKTPPNRIVNDDIDNIITNKPQSQEWITRKSPTSSPLQKSNPPQNKQPITLEPISIESESILLPDSLDNNSIEVNNNIESNNQINIVSKPLIQEDICSMDLDMEDTYNISSNNNEIIENNEVIANNEIENNVDNNTSEVIHNNTCTLPDSPIKSFSAPSKHTDIQYEEHEVFLVPSQPSPVKHQKQKELTEQPLSTLAEKWNKRKLYQKQLKEKAQLKEKLNNKNLEPYSPHNNNECTSNTQNEEGQVIVDNNSSEENILTSQNLNLSPSNTINSTTPQTIPCISQGSPISYTPPTPPEQIKPLKTLAEQWEERKNNISKSNDNNIQKISPMNECNILSSQESSSVDEEIKQLEILEKENERKRAEEEQIKQSLRIKAALEEQEKIKQLNEEKKRLEEQIIKERQIQQERITKKKLLQEKKKNKKTLLHSSPVNISTSSSLNSSSPSIVVSKIKPVVSLCRQKQYEIENQIQSPMNSLSGEEIRNSQSQELELLIQERKEQENILSQKLDDILIQSSQSGDIIMEDEEDVDSIGKIPVRQPEKIQIKSLLSTQHTSVPSNKLQKIQVNNNNTDDKNIPCTNISQISNNSQQSSFNNDTIMEDNFSSSDNLSSFDNKNYNIKSQQFSTSNSSNNNNLSPIILASGLSSIMLQRIFVLVQELGGKMVSKFDDSVTHLVVLTTNPKSNITQRTLKYNQAILSGIWIVNYDWILNSYLHKTWVNENKYEIKGDTTYNNGKIPQKARYLALKNSPRLFSGLKFYLCGNFKGIDKNSLRTLIKTGNGKIYSSLPKLPKTTKEEIQLSDSFKSWIIICDGTTFDYDSAKDIYFKSGILPLSYEYLFDCISYLEILPKSTYEILETSSQQFQTQCSQVF